MEVYILESTAYSATPPPNFAKASDEIQYSVDGEDSHVRRWGYLRDEKYGDRVWFAPTLVAESLVEALLKNPLKLVITRHPG